MEQFDEAHHALVMEAMEEREHLRDLLTSVRAIAERCGANTNWEALDAKIASFGIGSVTPRTFKIVYSPEEMTDQA